MGWCSLILVLVVLMHHGTLKTTPLDDLTINDAPNGGPTIESPGIESEEWKTGKTSTKGPSYPQKSTKRQREPKNKKRKRIYGNEVKVFDGRVPGVPDWGNWIASLRVEMTGQPYYSLCGGVLISNQHILTALHCIFDVKRGFCGGDVVPKNKILIYFAHPSSRGGQIWKWNTEGMNDKAFTPIKYFYLKNILYKPTYLTNFKDDIAVIKLNDTVNPLHFTPLQISTRAGLTLSDVGSRIPAPEQGQYWIAGWGIYAVDPERVSPFLRYTNEFYGIPCPPATAQLSKIMCYLKNSTSDTPCQGDSGSPGVILIDGEWHVQGIISRSVNLQNKAGNCSIDDVIISKHVDVYKYRQKIQEWIDYTGPSCFSCLGQEDDLKFANILGVKTNKPYWGKWTASLKIIISDLELKTCGGVLISNKHILTALHCVTDGSRDLYPLDRVEIYFDPESLEIWQGTQFQAVEYFYTNKPSKHEYLPNTDQKMLEDDIVVIKLDRKIENDDCLLPIPISTEPLTDKKYWMFYTDKHPTMACPDLQATNICFQRTNQDGICHGDAGAPGVVSINDVWHLQGIHIGAHKIPPHKTSECSEPESISVDIDVSKYREHIVEWIKQKNDK